MRKILHVDADCFFAAVEMRENPKLRAVPLAVGGDPGRRGVIATCNYEARRFGIHSAMPSAVAMRQCPHLIILKPNIGLYRDVSAQMRSIFADYTDVIEPLSLDEAYLDLSASTACHGSATLVAAEIRSRIKSELGITVSAGAAPVKFLAKIASDWRKPDGFYAITPAQVEAFVAQLSVKSLPGVGPATETKLNRHGLYACQDLRDWGQAKLIHHFGSYGDKLYRMAMGQDERAVVADRVRKSVSVERTYASDLGAEKDLELALQELLADLAKRFERISGEYLPQKQFVKLKFDDFTQTTLEAPLSARRSWQDARSFSRLLQAAWHRHKRPVRLVGLGLRLHNRLDMARQLPLFDDLQLVPS